MLQINRYFNYERNNQSRSGGHIMKLPRIYFAVVAFGLQLQAGFLLAQTPTTPPKLNHVVPMGGQAGSTFELKVTCQDAELEGLYFNFPGVTAVPEGSEKTTLPKTAPMKKQITPKTPQGLVTHRFKVTLPANAPLGIQDVRVVSKGGVSNPRAFVVSDQKEFVEEEPNDDVPKAQRIELNSTVNGVILTPTDVDYYVFAGKKGQRVVLACLSTSIDSRLPAMLQVYGADGGYLGSNRGYSNNDAVFDATLPADGDYYVRVFSFSYTQGGVDNFYRLTVTTNPWIDAVFPPTVEPGKESKVTVYGRNLPGGKPDPGTVLNERVLEKLEVTVKPSADPSAAQRLDFSGFTAPPASMIDGFDLRVKGPTGQSNPFLLTYASGPVVLDAGDNDSQEKAQKLSVPGVIAGRIEKKGDQDWYAISVKKGQRINIEAFGDRLGAPIDLYFQLRDDKGTLVTEQDDNIEVLAPQFFTRNDDPPTYRFVPTADGTYYLKVTTRDAFTLAGPRHYYIVRVTTDEPDFRLVATPRNALAPDSVSLNQGGGAAYQVYVWRFGGFSEEITLEGQNLPAGVVLNAQKVPPGVKVSTLVVHANAGAANYVGGLKIIGSATVDGKKLVREVRAATVTWPVVAVNTPTITRLDRELVVAVRDKAAYQLVAGGKDVVAAQGDKISIPVKLNAQGEFKGSVQVAALNPPPGLVSQNVTLTMAQAGGAVTLDAKAVAGIQPGSYTIFLIGQTQPVNPKTPPAKGMAGPPNIVQISTPVTLVIVPKQLAKVTASPLAAKSNLGKDVEITVRAARQYDLSVSFKVELILPPTVKGISAKEATIKAGEDETKLIVSISPQAQVGAAQGLTIRATAMFNGNIPIVHDTKLTLSIAK